MISANQLAGNLLISIWWYRTTAFIAVFCATDSGQELLGRLKNSALHVTDKHVTLSAQFY